MRSQGGLFNQGLFKELTQNEGWTILRRIACDELRRRLLRYRKECTDYYDIRKDATSLFTKGCTLSHTHHKDLVKMNMIGL